MDYKAMLLSLLEALKISKNKFAESLNLSQGNVSDWFNKPNARPSIDALKKICEVHNVNINWFLTGKGDMFISSISSIPSIEFEHSKLSRINIAGDISAGSPIEISDTSPHGYIYIDSRFITADCYVFRVNGDSMYPEIKHNDLVLIRQTEVSNIEQGSVVAVRIFGEITLKAMYKDDYNKKTILVPYNQKHYPIVLSKHTHGDPVIIGVMVLLIRNYADKCILSNGDITEEEALSILYSRIGIT